MTGRATPDRAAILDDGDVQLYHGDVIDVLRSAARPSPPSPSSTRGCSSTSIATPTTAAHSKAAAEKTLSATPTAAA